MKFNHKDDLVVSLVISAGLIFAVLWAIPLNFYLETPLLVRIVNFPLTPFYSIFDNAGWFLIFIVPLAYLLLFLFWTGVFYLIIKCSRGLHIKAVSLRYIPTAIIILLLVLLHSAFDPDKYASDCLAGRLEEDPEECFMRVIRNKPTSAEELMQLCASMSQEYITRPLSQAQIQNLTYQEYCLQQVALGLLSPNTLGQPFREAFALGNLVNPELVKISFEKLCESYAIQAHAPSKERCGRILVPIYEDYVRSILPPKPSAELLTYIENVLSQGMSIEEMYEVLQKNGWSIEVIDAAMKFRKSGGE